MRYYDDWKPYVSVASRRQSAAKAAAKAAKSGLELEPVANFRGAIAKTFWGKSWCQNLERYSDFSNRLPRGRSYVRNGSVIDLKIGAGEVKAQVMGSSLYRVIVRVQPVPPQHWQKLCNDCAGSIDSLVEMLQGRLSDAVMDHICKPGTGLFPAPKELSFDCSCPDYATMCKHVAAVLYGVGNRLDHKPELLFELRHVQASDLIAQAGSELAQPGPRTKSKKVLREASLADMFGIEMADTPAPTKVRAKPGNSTAAKAVAPKPAAGKTATPAAKRAVAKKSPARRAPVRKVAAAPAPLKVKPGAVVRKKPPAGSPGRKSK